MQHSEIFFYNVATIRDGAQAPEVPHSSLSAAFSAFSLQNT
jgi:hypothetical protein